MKTNHKWLHHSYKNFCREERLGFVREKEGGPSCSRGPSTAWTLTACHARPQVLGSGGKTTDRSAELRVHSFPTRWPDSHTLTCWGSGRTAEVLISALGTLMR